MTAENSYPELVIDLGKLRHNIRWVKEKCHENGVKLAGVIKGCSGIPECVKEFEDAGCDFIASSRLEQLEPLKSKGTDIPLMMIRIPMISEAADVVRITDISLNSETEVLKELNRQAEIQGRTHQVILMIDLGDLREGFWGTDQLTDAALLVENELENLYLAGVGTNLGCYGAIVPTREKLDELAEAAEAVESAIGRKLDYISGGSTRSFSRVLDGDLPDRINMLRMGEGILMARELQELWEYDLSSLYKDVFTLRAEIIEVKTKPTYPVGEIYVDAFGGQPEYEDLGMRKRALLAVGKVDCGSYENLIPLKEGVKIIGASGDHTIADIEECCDELKPGDVLEFELNYYSTVYLTASANVKHKFVR